MGIDRGNFAVLQNTPFEHIYGLRWDESYNLLYLSA